MWNNYYYNTGTGVGGDVYVNINAPVYDVNYVGESPENIYYRRPKQVKVKYVGQDQVQMSYVADKRKLKVHYSPIKKIKITLVCH